MSDLLRVTLLAAYATGWIITAFQLRADDWREGREPMWVGILLIATAWPLVLAHELLRGDDPE